MATQDSSGGVNWGKVALSALGGAAAGYSADNVGEGFVRGLSFQQSQQDRQREIARQAKKDEQINRLNAAKIRYAELNIEAQKQNMLAKQEKFSLDYFKQRSSFYKQLGQAKVDNLTQSFATRGVHGTNESKTLMPVNELQSKAVVDQSRAAEVTANIDEYIFAINEMKNPRSPSSGRAARERAAILGAQLEIEYVADGDFVKTPFGTMKANAESAEKLSQAFKERALGSLKYLQHVEATRNLSDKAAQRFFAKRSIGIDHLNDKDVTSNAEGFSKAIQNSLPHQKVLSVLVPLDRQLKEKDPDFGALEIGGVMKTLTDAGVKFEKTETGKFFLDVDGFNRWANGYKDHGEQKAWLQGAGMVEVTPDMVSNGFADGGFNDLANQFLDDLKLKSERRERDAAKKIAQSIKAEGLKEEAEEVREMSRTQKKIQDFRGTPEQIVRRYKFDDGSTLDSNEVKAAKIAGKNHAQKQFEAEISKAFEKRFNRPVSFLDEDVPSADTALEDRQKQARKWYESRIDKGPSKELMDSSLVDIVRTLSIDPNARRAFKDNVMHQVGQEKLRRMSVEDFSETPQPERIPGGQTQTKQSRLDSLLGTD